MSKEGLEALEELKGVLAYFGAHTEKAIESCNTIEKELKEHEKYKAIEEELGIDFLIFVKALENGFYRYRSTARNNVICFIAKPKVNMKQKCFTYGSYGKSYFKDYGKTWALTREELL